MEDVNKLELFGKEKEEAVNKCKNILNYIY